MGEWGVQARPSSRFARPSQREGEVTRERCFARPLGRKREVRKESFAQPFGMEGEVAKSWQCYPAARRLFCRWSLGR